MKQERHSIPGLLPVLLASLLQGCWPDGPSSKPEAPPEGMVSIAAANRHAILGSEDPYAKKDEEVPRLTAVFGYAFFMDRTEVTQGAYEALMGRNPATEDFGRGTDLPVYNVTWYDALLYCNARGKAQGLDTVYTYSGRQQDAHGRTSSLTGLNIRYEVRGYRLPTEAEWEFAARGGVTSVFPWGEVPDSAAAAKTAWHTANAGGRAHPVGQLRANGYGLYDMMGNVMEWVNDWKSPYAAVEVADFLGSRDPGLLAERSVKGGAFSYDFRYLRFSGRSANYPTLGSAATEYVGFRCVLGAIPRGKYLSGGKPFSATPPVTPEPAAVLRLFGHNRVKLVFVNTTLSTRTLCYIDYSESPVVVHEFLDDSTVFTPVVSPDGQWVAYANVEEGSSGTGTVKIRRLTSGGIAQALPVSSAAIPRWWVNLASKDTFLVYATSARDNTEPFWGSDQTYRLRISGGVAAGAPVLMSSGGYHDGLSSDGKYLATGYRRLRLRNSTAGSERILFTGPLNGKSPGDTSQVCNLSLNPDFAAAPEMLLLDFGFPLKSSVVGRAYGLHEILFRVDTAGRVTRWYEAPAGFAAWQDAEWSNHPDYAAGVGEDAGRGYPALVGIHLRTSATAVLARGSTLREPGLWIQPGTYVPSDPGVADSMGEYNTPLAGHAQAEFAAKMRVFWLNRDSAEFICLGSSHVKSGVWPQSMPRFKTLNLGYSAGNVAGPAAILRNYVLRHSRSLRAVLFEVHPGWLFDWTEEWGLQMGRTKGYLYDSSHFFWAQSVPPFLDSVMRQKTYAGGFVVDARGGSHNASDGWGSTPPVMLGRGLSFSLPDPKVSANLAQIGDLAREAGSQGVLFVMTVFPQSPRYKNTPYYGKYGPTRESGRTLVAQFKALCAEIPNCRFYDANQEGNHDYDSLMFVNEDHLSTVGAMRLSPRLDSALNVWLSGSP